MNNSTTQSINTPFNHKPNLSVFHLSNDRIILGNILNQTDGMVFIHFPVELIALFDSDRDFQGFSMMPYLLPFIDFDVDSVVNFNTNQIVSFSKPAKEIIKQYIKILRKFADGDNSDNSDDLSSMKIPPVKH